MVPRRQVMFTYLCKLIYVFDVCVLNVRFGSESYNLTPTSTRGKAVVDYMVLPHDQLEFENNLKIITLNEISSILKKYVTDKCKLPDHSILYFNLRMSYSVVSNKHWFR